MFIPKIESLKINSVICVKRCVHYRGPVVQKRLVIGQGVKIEDYKNRGGGVNEPPASLRVNTFHLLYIFSILIFYDFLKIIFHNSF